MITPAFLKKGDKIGIVAPARKIQMSEIEAAIKVFEWWGLEVELGKNIFAQHQQFAGTDEQRASDLQDMFDNPEIKAIVSARGGYGTIKTMKHLSFTKFIENPKWIVGYSDITVLHAHLNQNLGIKSVHGTMPLNFLNDTSENKSIKSLKKALFGEHISYEIDDNDLNKLGKAEGELSGGNLSVIYSLAGTEFDINMDEKILFIEDLDEYLYHIDRMMMNLKHGGKLKNLKAIIVGGMTEMNDNIVAFGKSANEIILEAVQEYNYPVCFNFPAGHLKTNLALVLGSWVKLDINNRVVEFSSQ